MVDRKKVSVKEIPQIDLVNFIQKPKKNLLQSQSPNTELTSYLKDVMKTY